MSLASDVEELKSKVEKYEQGMTVSDKQKEEKKFQFKIKIPSGVKRKAKKEGVFAVLILGNDMRGRFTNGYYNDGNILVEDKQFAYEKATVFWVNKGKIPLIVYYDWRITPIAGTTDGLVHSGYDVANLKEDHEAAEALGLTNYGQQTVIRAIKQAQLPDLKKSFGGGSWLWYIIGGVVVIYLISEFMKTL